MCYLGNPGPLLAGTLLGQVWAEREEKLRAGAVKAKASRLRLGYIQQGHGWKQARDLAEGNADTGQTGAWTPEQLSYMVGGEVKQCWAFPLLLPR